jgi:hypothetical protein
LKLKLTAAASKAARFSPNSEPFSGIGDASRLEEFG